MIYQPIQIGDRPIVIVFTIETQQRGLLHVHTFPWTEENETQSPTDHTPSQENQQGPTLFPEHTHHPSTHVNELPATSSGMLPSTFPIIIFSHLMKQVIITYPQPRPSQILFNSRPAPL